MVSTVNGRKAENGRDAHSNDVQRFTGVAPDAKLRMYKVFSKAVMTVFLRYRYILPLIRDRAGSRTMCS